MRAFPDIFLEVIVSCHFDASGARKMPQSDFTGILVVKFRAIRDIFVGVEVWRGLSFGFYSHLLLFILIT